jgi:hypothetical protein
MSRRWIGVAVVGGILALGLSGCSAVGSFTTSSDGSIDAAVTIGEQAVGATVSTAPSSAAGATGWNSSVSCPDTFRDGLLTTAPAGTTATPLDAAATTGIVGDPGVSAGDRPTCAYAVSIQGRTIDALAFLGMGTSYQSAIISKLQSDGFTAGKTEPEAGGTLQEFTKGTTTVGVEKLTILGQPMFGLIG